MQIQPEPPVAGPWFRAKASPKSEAAWPPTVSQIMSLGVAWARRRSCAWRLLTRADTRPPPSLRPGVVRSVAQCWPGRRPGAGSESAGGRAVSPPRGEQCWSGSSNRTVGCATPPADGGGHRTSPAWPGPGPGWAPTAAHAVRRGHRYGRCGRRGWVSAAASRGVGDGSTTDVPGSKEMTSTSGGRRMRPGPGRSRRSAGWPRPSRHRGAGRRHAGP